MTDAPPRTSHPSIAGLRGARAPAALSNAYSAYIVAMLAVVAMLNTADRYCLSILLVPIQRDLQISDTMMGVLSGASYALVFAVAGIPLARLADQSNRRNLLAGAVAIWSAFTALCGAAVHYVHLFAARAGVAAAESAFQPIFVSMVGDLFSPARRGLAISLIMMGGGAGIVVGSVVAGLTAEAYGWQAAFIALGAPGILIALLFWLTVPEPARGAKDGGVKNEARTKTTWGALAAMFAAPTAWRLILASVMLLAAQGAWGAWLPTFFLRVHNMSLSHMSASYGAAVGVSAMLSMVISGFLSDWLAKRGEASRIRFIGATLLVGSPIFVAATLVANVWLAWGLITVFQVIVSGAPPVVSAAGLGVVHPRARALWVSIYNFSGYAVGGLIGAVTIGGLSDLFAREHGEMAIRYSILAVPGLLVPAALLYFWTSLTANRDAQRVREADASAPA